MSRKYSKINKIESNSSDSEEELDELDKPSRSISFSNPGFWFGSLLSLTIIVTLTVLLAVLIPQRNNRINDLEHKYNDLEQQYNNLLQSKMSKDNTNDTIQSLNRLFTPSHVISNNVQAMIPRLRDLNIDSILSPPVSNSVTWKFRTGSIEWMNIAVFNLANSTWISNDQLKNGLQAVFFDIVDNVYPEWFIMANIELYGPNDLNRPELFNGSRIPVFLLNKGGPNDRTTEYSWDTNNGANEISISDRLGITIPVPIPDGLPWSFFSITPLEQRLSNVLKQNNPYEARNMTEAIVTYLDLLIKQELLNQAEGTNEFYLMNWNTDLVSQLRWLNRIGTSSPALWNSMYNPVTRFHELPLLSSELSDYVSLYVPKSILSVFSNFLYQRNTYAFMNWKMVNFPLKSFFQSYYYPSLNGKFDYLGNTNSPGTPYGTKLPYVLLVDENTKTSYYGSIFSNGLWDGTITNTTDLLSAAARWNFPANYIWFTTS
jgi:hypothetical protein